ncbi:aminotransferase class III-fold pyridoxal phosphate-dependent enzyme [uncultured Litoreibacter sp.]|uniref:aminotransferase class III-fold pyridoxal phosphate-dependent enzyme n=1 Tax=uncultured Litoreibacter sp. TaxID=1392394 RepID=UPI00262FD01A|nr:aminotransferase class III-fold pyridoxal phosphate-dependent enzyme [uncultured Litoreibacter sp.]
MKDDNFLKENNARHMWHPMAHPGAMQDHPPRIISKAEGSMITDHDGNTVVDGVGGLWCVNVGYSCDPIKKAIADQVVELPYYSAFGGTTNEPAIELSYELREMFAPDGMARAFFTSGGSDAVETALRLARQYHKVKGQPQRTKFLSLKKGYHGTHFGGASVNGNNRFRINYEPLMPGCFHLPTPYAYRNPFDETDPKKLGDLCVKAAIDEIEFQGPDTIACFIMEPIQGAGGVIVPPEHYMPAMRQVTEKYGILMIADEVITGFGRSGDWSGSRHWGVKPDMMTMAKGITSGYFPFGACMVSEAVAEVFENGDPDMASIFHGYTYSAHPVGAAAALACIRESQRLKINENAAPRGTQLFEGLLKLKEKYDVIGDVRGGHGLMTGLEFVTDKASKTPAPMAMLKTAFETTYEAGAMVRIGGNNLLMSPPLVITEAEINTILTALEAGVQAASSA